MTIETQLVHFDAAKKELALATKLDEVKQIRDKAEALRQYIRQQGESLEMQNYCAEIKIRAERRAGEMLRENPAVQHGGDRKSSLHDESLKLKDLGISYIQSHRWQQAATVPEEVLEGYIAETKEKGGEITSVGVQRLAIQTQQKERMEQRHTIPLPEGKYHVIYCDPPWEYSNSGFKMSAVQKYPTMSIEDLESLGIGDLASENAVMFMWATNPLLKDALNLMEKWGFEYKTNIAWIKERHTAGFYVFGKHELLLIGVKGSMLPDGKPESVVYGENKVHSKKPETIYEIIEKMYPGMNYVELFARALRQNWTAWGDEV